MADPIENTPIPSTPPSGSGATQGAMAGIAAIIAACDAGGFKSKYAKCALLAIAGTESKWMYSAEEGMNYSKKKLLSGMFSGVTEAEAEQWYNAGKRGIPRVVFFGWLYGTNKGKAPAEGNYYGRGFVQLTSKSHYDALSKRLGVDLVNNPNKVIESPEFGAKLVVEFFKWKIKTWESDQWSPGFFQQAMRATGGAKSGWPEKTRYYEYFLGGKAADAPTNKDASNTSANKTQQEIDSASPSKREAYTEDRSGNFSVNGFTDPEGKYPLRDYMNEPDTNRLARGIIDNTCVKFKDTIRKTNIPVANTSGTYDQPESAYNTVYPYNKVMESESGHVLEFDDSPDGERINLFHRKGTFIEIDPNGTQVNYIVGDGFWITERNGNIFINGTANLTVSGPMNILVQGDTNLEVCGQVDAVFHNNVNMGVALDLNVAVGGDYNVLVEGNYNVEVGKTSNHRTIGTMSMESSDALKLKTAKTMSLEGGDTQSTAETLMKMSSAIRYETSDAFEIKAKSFKVEVDDTAEIKSGSFKAESINGNLELKSSDEVNILSSNNFNVTGAEVQLNPSSAVSIDSITTIANLGTPQKPVDFAGNEIANRDEEHVLVDTVLTPSGEYNPNTLNDKVIENVLSGSLTGIDIYDVKYNGPVERKTNLAAAGNASSHRLVVPPVDSAHQPGSENLVPPARHTDPIAKYETEDDWNSAAGSKARKNMTSTSDYEHNGGIPGQPQDSSSPSGGNGTGTGISTSKQAEIDGQTDFPSNYKLSEHFTLGMLVHSQGHALKDTVLPDGAYSKQKLVANLSALCENILEKVYSEIGPCTQQDPAGKWRITSGLRNEKNGSFHNKGEACDIQLISRNINEHYDLAIKLEKILPYNQILLEYRNKGTSVWIHLSYSMKGSMKLCSTYVDDKNVNGSGKVSHGSNGFHKFYT